MCVSPPREEEEEEEGLVATCQEGLSEVEARDPEHTGSPVLNPVLEKLQPAK